MGEEYAPNFKEIFQCTVIGKDIAEARFNAFTALEQVLGDSIHQKHHWKLAQMEHGIGSRPNPDEETQEESPEIPCVLTQAVWIFDPDSDEGKGAELLPPDPETNPDGIEQPDLHLVDNA